MDTLETLQDSQSPILKLDKWQQEVLDYDGNITIRSGRQVGKSTIIGIKAAKFARDHPNSVTLVIAAAVRQSGWIFERIKNEFNPDEFGAEPTLSRIILKNGARVYSYPAGKTGVFIRGLTVDLLIVDEAAYIPEVVWRSVIPMIATRTEKKTGFIILLSTPFGKGGYFYASFTDPDFKKFHVSSESCKRISPLFLEKEKKRMSKVEYAQEYLGEFIDDYNQFFPSELIKRCMTFIEWDSSEINREKSYYLGVDIARYGGDQNAFVIAEMDHKKRIRIVKALTTSRVSLTDTIGRILILDEKFKFKRIFVDDAGIGGGVTDVLLEKLGRRIVGINNARRSVDRADKKKAIMKEDLYSNALVLMESNMIEIISDLDLLRSLKSIVYEYSADKNVKLFGDYSHIAEAFVRACWCIRDRGLNIYCV